MESKKLDSCLFSVPGLGNSEQITQPVWALVVSTTKWNNTHLTAQSHSIAWTSFLRSSLDAKSMMHIYGMAPDLAQWCQPSSIGVQTLL